MDTLSIVNIVTVPSLNKTAILWQKSTDGVVTTAENWIEEGILNKDAALELAKKRVDAGIEVSLSANLTMAEINA